MGAILCGGQASRMGGEKAMADLAGQPLVGHVIGRLEPQVGSLLLCVESPSSGLESLGLNCVPDAVSGHRGPLIGLYSALAAMSDEGPEWLQLAPCDAPFLPLELADLLAASSLEAGVSVAAPRYEGVVQPTFSLWHRSLLDGVREAVMGDGQGGLMAMLDRTEHAVVDWASAMPPPFFNVNSVSDLSVASVLLDGQRGRATR
ncbi:MAG: molybdenum cofactor guanylyltransferase [Xanthomonadales bacterium]|nr:molybdenum cofactor guanylyltransferase [Xanthomonadales bacterium]